MLRSARPERRRQDDHGRAVRGPARARRRRRSRCSGERWQGDGAALRERLGVQLQETRFPEKLRVGELAALFRSFYRDGLEPRGRARPGRARGEDSAPSCASSRAARSSASRSPAPWWGIPRSCSSTSRRPGSTRPPRRQIWEIVERLKARGRTVLLTTHYMEEAARLCDRVAIIDRGKLLALGPPRELVASLGAEHVIELETEAALPDDLLAGLPGVERIERVERLAEGASAVVRLTVREVHRVVPPLLARLAERGIEARRFTTHHATLEDVFLALTGRSLESEAA